jgi:hypothetical protein
LSEQHCAFGAILLFVADLLAQITLVAHLRNLMDLRFQPIDVLFFVFEEPFE